MSRPVSLLLVGLWLGLLVSSWMMATVNFRKAEAASVADQSPGELNRRLRVAESGPRPIKRSEDLTVSAQEERDVVASLSGAEGVAGFFLIADGLLKVVECPSGLSNLAPEVAELIMSGCDVLNVFGGEKVQDRVVAGEGTVEVPEDDGVVLACGPTIQEPSGVGVR